MTMKNNKNAVVTGATGMLALALMRKLIKEGYHIFAVARPNSKRIINIPKSDMITIIECDICDFKNLCSMISSECDIFFHFAWDGTYGSSRNDMELQIKNIQASVDAVYVAHELGCSVFLGAGSQAEYGRKDTAITPDMPTHPENGYGISKLCAGQMTRLLCKDKGIKHIWCRIFSTYGPYDGNHTMVMSGINQLLKGEKPSYTAGEQMWDYLYCDDAANAFYLAAQKGKDGSAYCVGSGKQRKMSDFINDIKNTINPNADIGLGDLPYFENQVMYLCADITALHDDTGFEPEYSFIRGIEETVKWAKQYYRT